MHALEPQDLDALAARAAAGDREAFDALYAECAGRIFALCLRMCADRAEAERLVQEVFVRAWRGLAGFRGAARFTTWLHRLAVNLVLEDRRSTGRRVSRIHAGSDVAMEHSAARRDDAGLRIDLERAIAELPPRARHVLVLYDIEGYDQAEIGRMLGIAVGTVKAQLHRARRLLRARLGGES